MPLLKVRHLLFLFTLAKWLFRKVGISHSIKLEKTYKAIDQLRVTKAILQGELVSADAAVEKLDSFLEALK